MSKFSFFLIMLPVFPLIESKDCPKAGKSITLTFVHVSTPSTDETCINVRANVLLQSPTDEMYISVGNQSNLLRILYNTCEQRKNKQISCSIESLPGYFHLDTVIVMSNTTLIDCKFHIEKIDSQLKSILRLTPRSTNSIEPNGTHSQGFSHNRRPFYDDDQPDPLMMRKLIISLSILAFFTSLLCTGLCAYYINRRLHLRRIRKKRKKAGIFSIRQSLEQFPVIVFMARDQKQNFPNEICPRCSICFEPLCDHTRVRKLNCSHYFHILCLTSWVLTHEKCPVCSRRIFDNLVPTISADVSIVHDELTDFSMISDVY